MATTVNIHLPINSGTEWICALSIPRKEIKRLSSRPLKWLRFATFTVCGAKGHLSATEGGETVDYESVPFANLADRYFYNPDNGGYHLVDHKAIGEKNASSAVNERRATFRRQVCARDHGCAVMGCGADECQAAHIIPKRKGSGYISFVVRDRSCLYDQIPFFPEEDGQFDVDINCVENGILLETGLHDLFDKGKLGFLKTPNFAMDPRDVPWVEEGPVPDKRTTLQYLRERTGDFSSAQKDALVDWGDDGPPSILLDFMYGAAIAKWWKTDRLQRMLEERYKDFDRALKPNPSDQSDPGEDPHDPDYILSESTPPSTPPKRTRKRRRTGGGLVEAMDDILLLSMLLKGTTPQAIVAEQGRQLKKEELRSQERSREKVQEWLKSCTVRPLGIPSSSQSSLAYCHA